MRYFLIYIVAEALLSLGKALRLLLVLTWNLTVIHMRIMDTYVKNVRFWRKMCVH